MLPCHIVAIDTQQYVYTHTRELGRTQCMSILIIVLKLGKTNTAAYIHIIYNR